VNTLFLAITHNTPIASNSRVQLLNRPTSRHRKSCCLCTQRLPRCVELLSRRCLWYKHLLCSMTSEMCARSSVCTVDAVGLPPVAAQGERVWPTLRTATHVGAAPPLLRVQPTPVADVVGTYTVEGENAVQQHSDLPAGFAWRAEPSPEASRNLKVHTAHTHWWASNMYSLRLGLQWPVLQGRFLVVPQDASDNDVFMVVPPALSRGIAFTRPALLQLAHTEVKRLQAQGDTSCCLEWVLTHAVHCTPTFLACTSASVPVQAATAWACAALPQGGADGNAWARHVLQRNSPPAPPPFIAQHFVKLSGLNRVDAESTHTPGASLCSGEGVVLRSEAPAHPVLRGDAVVAHLALHNDKRKREQFSCLLAQMVRLEPGALESNDAKDGVMRGSGGTRVTLFMRLTPPVRQSTSPVYGGEQRCPDDGGVGAADAAAAQRSAQLEDMHTDFPLPDIPASCADGVAVETAVAAVRTAVHTSPWEGVRLGTRLDSDGATRVDATVLPIRSGAALRRACLPDTARCTHAVRGAPGAPQRRDTPVHSPPAHETHWDTLEALHSGGEVDAGMRAQQRTWVDLGAPAAQGCSLEELLTQAVPALRVALSTAWALAMRHAFASASKCAEWDECDVLPGASALPPSLRYACALRATTDVALCAAAMATHAAALQQGASAQVHMQDWKTCTATRDAAMKALRGAQVSAGAAMHVFMALCPRPSAAQMQHWGASEVCSLSDLQALHSAAVETLLAAAQTGGVDVPTRTSHATWEALRDTWTPPIPSRLLYTHCVPDSTDAVRVVRVRVWLPTPPLDPTAATALEVTRSLDACATRLCASAALAVRTCRLTPPTAREFCAPCVQWSSFQTAQPQGAAQWWAAWSGPNSSAHLADAVVTSTEACTWVHAVTCSGSMLQKRHAELALPALQGDGHVSCHPRSLSMDDGAGPASPSPSTCAGANDMHVTALNVPTCLGVVQQHPTVPSRCSAAQSAATPCAFVKPGTRVPLAALPPPEPEEAHALTQSVCAGGPVPTTHDVPAAVHALLLGTGMPAPPACPWEGRGVVASLYALGHRCTVPAGTVRRWVAAGLHTVCAVHSNGCVLAALEAAVPAIATARDCLHAALRLRHAWCALRASAGAAAPSTITATDDAVLQRHLERAAQWVLSSVGMRRGAAGAHEFHASWSGAALPAFPKGLTTMAEGALQVALRAQGPEGVLGTLLPRSAHVLKSLHAPLRNITQGEVWSAQGAWRQHDLQLLSFRTPYDVQNTPLLRAAYWGGLYPMTDTEGVHAGTPQDSAALRSARHAWGMVAACRAVMEWYTRYGRVVRSVLPHTYEPDQVTLETVTHTANMLSAVVDLGDAHPALRRSNIVDQCTLAPHVGVNLLRVLPLHPTRHSALLWPGGDTEGYMWRGVEQPRTPPHEDCTVRLQVVAAPHDGEPQADAHARVHDAGALQAAAAAEAAEPLDWGNVCDDVW